MPMTDARAAIISRVRAANRGATRLPEALADWHTIPRDYVAGSERGRAEVLALFEDRLLDYDATVTRTTMDAFEAALVELLKQVGVRRIGVAPGFSTGALPEHFDIVVDAGLSHGELDGVEAVLSGCTVAIAETGTLVLQGDAGQGRRALSLIPDTYVCVVKTSQVVATVPEAFAWLERTPALPTTFVSGPSATADIEMTRIKGVHGPRFLHVVLVDDGEPVGASEEIL
jgi:L-lactate dehydrogenase complex protein LldG